MRPASPRSSRGIGDRKLGTRTQRGRMHLAEFLVFLDAPKRDAAESLRRLASLGIAVKVVTGDNPAVALKVCHELGLADGAALSGTDIDALNDEELAAAIPTTTVFARVSPKDEARIVRVQRRTGGGVAFLGDGVNDALALHAADVGISVDSSPRRSAARHPSMAKNSPTSLRYA